MTWDVFLNYVLEFWVVVGCEQKLLRWIRQLQLVFTCELNTKKTEKTVQEDD